MAVLRLACIVWTLDSRRPRGSYLYRWAMGVVNHRYARACPRSRTTCSIAGTIAIYVHSHFMYFIAIHTLLHTLSVIINSKIDIP